MPLAFTDVTGGARYPPVLSREGKLKLTKAQGRSTLDAGIPESFHLATPERIAPGGPVAKPEGIPVPPLAFADVTGEAPQKFWMLSEKGGTRAGSSGLSRLSGLSG